MPRNSNFPPKIFEKNVARRIFGPKSIPGPSFAQIGRPQRNIHGWFSGATSLKDWHDPVPSHPRQSRFNNIQTGFRWFSVCDWCWEAWLVVWTVWTRKFNFALCNLLHSLGTHLCLYAAGRRRHGNTPSAMRFRKWKPPFVSYNWYARMICNESLIFRLHF